jgi:predicted nucleic acid-binding protein
MIFVDSSFFFALASEEDPDHERVLEVFQEFDPKRLPNLWLTTNHVISETITLTRSSSGHREAVSMGRRLYKEILARIHWATPAEEKKAFDYLEKHSDKKYSAVDCLSFVIMEQYGIQEALTIDSDFTHRFIARPGPKPK